MRAARPTLATGATDQRRLGPLVNSKRRGNTATPAIVGRRSLLASVSLGLVLVPLQGRALAADQLPQQTPAPAEPTPSSSSPSSLPSSSTQQPSASVTPAPLDGVKLTEEAANRLLEEEEKRRKERRRKKGRIRELEEIRAELAEKELILLEQQQELLAKEQTVLVLKEELELERKLRALLTKEKEKAEEEAALAMGLCTGATLLP